MKVSIVCALSVFVIISSSFSAEARKKNRDGGARQWESSLVDESANDSDIIRAMSDQRNVNFVEGGSMTVMDILPDDTNGREHQKWTVRLSNGKTMQAVYNLDLCPRVPLKKGDVIAMGGQFIWTKRGGLLHWLHKDPKDRRPAGYVYVNGTYYCKDLN